MHYNGDKKPEGKWKPPVFACFRNVLKPFFLGIGFPDSHFPQVYRFAVPALFCFVPFICIRIQKANFVQGVFFNHRQFLIVYST